MPVYGIRFLSMSCLDSVASNTNQALDPSENIEFGRSLLDVSFYLGLHDNVVLPFEIIQEITLNVLKHSPT